MWLVLTCAALLFAFALVTVARRADESDDDLLGALRAAAALERLEDVRSPSGKPFFPDPKSRWELADALHDVAGPPDPAARRELATSGPVRGTRSRFVSEKDAPAAPSPRDAHRDPASAHSRRGESQD